MLRLRYLIRELGGILLIILFITAFRSAIADWNEVPTGSMLPTIVEGDRIYVDKLAYNLRIPFTHVHLNRINQPQRGDIVIFESAKADKRLVKRIIGVPGDIVAMQDNRLLINGIAASYFPVSQDDKHAVFLESWGEMQQTIQITKNSPDQASSFPAIQVPDAHYLVLGDNRDNSADSRYIGFVPDDEITGRAEKVIISLDYENYYLPRTHRFMHNLD